MNAATQRDFTARPMPSDFAKALIKERGTYGASRHQVADHCGVSVGKVEEWEKGTAVPDVATFKRLCGMFRRLNASPPNWTTARIATIGDRVAQQQALKIEPKPESKPAPIVVSSAEPEKFGRALQRIRKANGISTQQLGELIGVGGTAVCNWESCANFPATITVEKLYEVLPELKREIDTGKVERPPARERNGGRKPSKPALVVVPPPPPVALNGNEAKAEPAAKPERVLPEPTAITVAPPTDPFIELEMRAARYGKARALKLRKQRELAELRGRIADLEHEVSKLAADEDAALAALDEVAAEPSR